MGVNYGATNEPIEKKKCYKCGVDKKPKQYHKHRYSKPGRMVTCKLCLLKAYRLKCTNLQLAKTGEKMCSDCYKVKSAKDFYLYAGGNGSLRNKCKACTGKTSSKEYYKKLGRRKPKKVET